MSVVLVVHEQKCRSNATESAGTDLFKIGLVASTKLKQKNQLIATDLSQMGLTASSEESSLSDLSAVAVAMAEKSVQPAGYIIFLGISR